MSNPKSRSFVNSIVSHYLKYDKDNPFIFISAVMAFLGVAAGVAVMLIALAITTGIQKDFKERLFVMNYPLTVFSYGGEINNTLIQKMQEKFPTIKTSPYYTTSAVVKNKIGIQGSLIYGVDFQKESAINKVFAQTDLNNSYDGVFRMLIGDALSAELDAREGDKMTMYFSEQQAAGFATAPLQKRFFISGVFSSGLQAYDKGIVYTTQEAMVRLLKKNPNRYDGVHIYHEHPSKIINQLRAMLPDGVTVEGWWQQNASFFTMMEMEKKIYTIILLFIIFIASLNIISSLLMTVMSRRSEIALMRTLGASKKEIRQIFYRLGLIVGSGGIILGTLLGFLGMWVLENFEVVSLPADIFGSAKLPVDLTTSDFIMVIVGAAIIVMISSLYPAIKASSTDPLKVLRSE